MAQEGDFADPFAIPDFWKSSTWLEPTVLNVESPLFALDVSKTPHRLIAGAGIQTPEARVGVLLDAGFFGLPPVWKELVGQEKEMKTEPIDEPEQDSTVDSDVLPIPDSDPWLHDNLSLRHSPELKTWDAFNEQSRGTPPLSFITEAGPAAFDALVDRRQLASHAESNVVNDAAYLACLLNLAMGRSSLLFSWDAEKKAFVKTASQLRTSGLSLQSIAGIDKLCVECADATRHLQSFAEKAYSAASTPTKVALARAIDKLVLALQSELNFRGHSAQSMLQLQAVVKPAHAVLTYIRGLVGKLASQKSEEGILSCLFQEAQSAEYRNALLQEVACEILSLVSKPWTDFVEVWIGLKAERGIAVTRTGPGKGFVKVADKVWIDDMGYELEEPDFFLDEDKIPSFLPEDVARAAFEAGRNLRFLREHHPDHPLSQQETINEAKPPSLEWQFDWDALAVMESKANEYRSAVSRLVRNCYRDQGLGKPKMTRDGRDITGYEVEFFERDDAQIAATVLASISRLDQPLSNRQTEDGFSTILRERLYQKEGPSSNQHLSPYWSLVPLLSFGPVISAQSKVIDRECMKVLFSDHQLRMHMDLLKQCYLLDNGLLCSRLSHALFDPDLETTERRAGVALGGETMGLRLGGRENWPPASSELRLALMGVLSESYQRPPGYVQKTKGLASQSCSSDLPGDLSFAVRDLSPEEIDRCMDSDSLEALDFLRLSYKAPSPLRPILTPTVLVKYDRIFTSLLRMQRMLYVVNELFHDVSLFRQGGEEPSNAALRFRVEARHFVHQMATYFFDTGVAAPWKRFEAWLHAVEAEVSKGTGASEAENLSPDVLRDRQEQVLDEMISTLLLRKRQQPVLRLLEETFGVILRFAKQLRLQSMTAGGEVADSPEMLYSTFRKKVEVFLTVCRGLSEKAAASSRVGGHGTLKPAVENPIEHLLLSMDMSGFFKKLSAS